jgi:hypothetical protein
MVSAKEEEKEGGGSLTRMLIRYHSSSERSEGMKGEGGGGKDTTTTKKSKCAGGIAMGRRERVRMSRDASRKVFVLSTEDEIGREQRGRNRQHQTDA